MSSTSSRSVPVAITHCDTYTAEHLLESLRIICDAALMPDPKGKTVLLKPNILSDAPVEKSITTHPQIIRAMIRLLKERGALRILVGDSPGIHVTEFIPRDSGIYNVCQEESVQWCDFAKEPVMHTIPGTYGYRLPLPSVLEEVDLLISVCKMKTHQLMYTTGCVKNLFGLVPGLHKSSCHMMYPTRESFSRMIAGLYQVAAPSFAVMDAIVSMEGAGPASGLPRHTGLLMASCDCTAVDVAESLIMGYEPFSIPLTKELYDRRLTGWRQLGDITYPLLDASKLVVHDYKRIQQQPKTHLLNSLIGPLFTRYIKLKHQKKEPRPLFNAQTCIACGKCVNICPGKALHIGKSRKAEVDYNSCIRCYCCHEVCPVNAITIEKKELD
ncbi:MAG: DUF362 domain-containing protein [Sphaerochaetaceae bacterium]